MPSESQKTRGYILPPQIEGHDLICVRLKIPDDADYKAAFYGSLTELTKWWSWEKTGDTRGSQAAAYWRQIIYEHLIIQDCDELEFLDGDDMAQFRMCWFDTELGRVLRYSLNDGCTWHDVLMCDGTIPGTDDDDEPEVPPIDPIDIPGTTPQPDIVNGNRCRVINDAMYNAFFRSTIFFANVINVTPSSRPFALNNFLAGIGVIDGWREWYDVFSALMNKYIPHVTAIENVIDTAIWAEEGIDCVVSACYPFLADVDRSTMECIADGIDDLADALPSPSSDDLIICLRFMADFYRIYPLAVIRQEAFASAINTAVSDVCPDCDETVPTCPPKFVTFDAGSDPYTIVVGVNGFGVNGTLAAKGIDLPPNTLGTGGLVKENGVKVAIPTGGCYVKTVRFWHQLKLSNPTSNASVKITPPAEIRIYGVGGVLTGTASPRKSEFYQYISTGWMKIEYTFTTPPYSELVEVIMPYATNYAARVIDNRIDNIEIEFE